MLKRREPEPVLPQYVFYTAALPFYRRACIDALKNELGERVTICAGATLADPTVVTDIDPRAYAPIRNRYFAGRRLSVQTGHWRSALRADTAIFDLNPRGVSVWILSALRRVTRRRTLHWGHLHPRAGESSRSRWLRRLLRHLGNGTILYGYDSVLPAIRDLPSKPVWVAPNAIYRRSDLAKGAMSTSERSTVMYVGRLVDSKKVDRLVRAFCRSKARLDGATLTVVGDGPERARLDKLVTLLECEHSITLTGAVTAVDDLEVLYGSAFCSVSPGYAGLSVTQSLGFDVPILVAEGEHHAPEIELRRFGGVIFFDGNDLQSLTDHIDVLWGQRHDHDRPQFSEPVRQLYSAEAMASGICDALEDRPSRFEPDGWPA